MPYRYNFHFCFPLKINSSRLLLFSFRYTLRNKHIIFCDNILGCISRKWVEENLDNFSCQCLLGNNCRWVLFRFAVRSLKCPLDIYFCYAKNRLLITKKKPPSTEVDRGHPKNRFKLCFKNGVCFRILILSRSSYELQIQSLYSTGSTIRLLLSIRQR